MTTATEKYNATKAEFLETLSAMTLKIENDHHEDNKGGCRRNALLYALGNLKEIQTFIGA